MAAFAELDTVAVVVVAVAAVFVERFHDTEGLLKMEQPAAERLPAVEYIRRATHLSLRRPEGQKNEVNFAEDKRLKSRASLKPLKTNLPR